MSVWKKTCCAILTICLLASSLAGCSFISGSTSDDVLQKAIGIPKDTVMMTVNGTDITAEVLCYWVNSSVNYLKQQQYNYKDVVWTDEIEGTPVKEYVKQDAAETVLLYQIVEEKALENGCSLTEEDKAELPGQHHPEARDDHRAGG